MGEQPTTKNETPKSELPAPKTWPIDFEKEPLLASLKKDGLFDESKFADFIRIDPERKDNLVARFVYDERGVKKLSDKFEKVDGASLRKAYILREVFLLHNDKKMSEETKTLYSRELSAYPGYKESFKLTTAELIDSYMKEGPAKKALMEEATQKDKDKANQNMNAKEIYEYNYMKVTYMEMATMHRIKRDTEGASAVLELLDKARAKKLAEQKKQQENAEGKDKKDTGVVPAGGVGPASGDTGQTKPAESNKKMSFLENQDLLEMLDSVKQTGLKLASNLETPAGGSTPFKKATVSMGTKTALKSMA